METQPICPVFVLVLMCPSAPAQEVQTNGRNDRQVPHHSLMGMIAFQEIPCDS